MPGYPARDVDSLGAILSPPEAEGAITSPPVTLSRHQDALPAADLILEFGLASLAGYEYLQDLNLGSHPLGRDQAVQDTWGIQFGHYTTVSRLLYAVDEATVNQVQTALEAIVQPYIDHAVHEVLCRQEHPHFMW